MWSLLDATRWVLFDYQDSSVIFTGLVLQAIILGMSIMGIRRFSSPVLHFLSLQSAVGHVGFPVLAHQYSPSQQKDLTHSPHSVSGPRNGGFCKVKITLGVLLLIFPFFISELDEY